MQSQSHSPTLTATTPPLHSVLMNPKQWSYVQDPNDWYKQVEHHPVALLEIKLTPTMVVAAQVVYRNLLSEMDRNRFCVHCRLRYSMWESAGLHPCHGHPGRIRNGVWTCCSQSAQVIHRAGFIDGCTPCDHTDSRYYHTGNQYANNNVTCIPLLVFLLMPQHQYRQVRGIYHHDNLPETYKRAMIKAVYGDMLDEEEEDDALEEWTGENGASTVIPLAFRATHVDLTAFDQGITIEEDTFNWTFGGEEVKLSDYHVIIDHSRT